MAAVGRTRRGGPRRHTWGRRRTSSTLTRRRNDGAWRGKRTGREKTKDRPHRRGWLPPPWRRRRRWGPRHSVPREGPWASAPAVRRPPRPNLSSHRRGRGRGRGGSDLVTWTPSGVPRRRPARPPRSARQGPGDRPPSFLPPPPWAPAWDPAGGLPSSSPARAPRRRRSPRSSRQEQSKCRCRRACGALPHSQKRGWIRRVSLRRRSQGRTTTWRTEWRCQTRRRGGQSPSGRRMAAVATRLPGRLRVYLPPSAKTHRLGGRIPRSPW